MADIKKQYNIGQIRLDPQSTAASFEWLIQDFLSLPQDPDYVFCSPVFSFHDAEWCLNFCPNGFTETNSVGWMALALGKLHSDTTNHKVSFKVCVKLGDDTEYGCFSGEENFIGDGCLCRAPFFGKRSRIFRRGGQISPDGTLIFSCTLRAMCPDEIAAASCQTDVPQRENSYSQTERNYFPENLTDVPKETEGDVYSTKEASNNLEGLDKLIHDFKDLLISGEDSDVSLKMGNNEFKVHRLILAARSPYFADKFRCDSIQSSSGVVDIPECNPDAFQQFLLYLYSGQIEKISEENVLELHNVGIKFDAKEVRSQCVKFWRNNISVDNFCDVIVLAILRNESELKRAATDFFVRNVRKIFKTSRWKDYFCQEYPAEANELHIKALEDFVPE